MASYASASNSLDADKLTLLVENHTMYRGKRRGKVLKREIVRLLAQNPQEYVVNQQGPRVYVGLNLGRVHISGSIDLS